MSARLRWPATICGSALALDVALLAGLHGPLRLLLALWFLLLCTGMAFVPLLAIPGVAIQLLLGVVISIVLNTLVTTAIVEIGGLSLWSGLAAVEAICLAGCASQVGWPGRGPRRAS